MPLATAPIRRVRSLACLLFAGLLALWLALSLAMPTAAWAQDSAAVPARTILVENLSIVKAEDMDFGNATVATGAGTIVLTPTATPTCTTTGGIIHSGECQPAVFVGAGRLNRLVRIRVPPGAQMTVTNATGATMRVDNMTVSGAPDSIVIRQNVRTYRFLIANLTGIFYFRVGGTLNVGAAQAPGTYTGTFDVDIQYF